MINKISRDIQFLQQQQIMDYSVLLTFGDQNPGHNYIEVGNKFLTFGIIDYLQEFNPLKKW